MARGKRSKAKTKKAAPKRVKPEPAIAASSPAPPEPKTEPPPKPEPPPPSVVTTPSKPPPGIAGMPSPPSDQLAAAAWTYELLIASLDDIRNDPDLSPRERRKEIRVQASAAAKAMPRARLYEAEKLVLEYKADLKRKANEKRGATLVPRPTRKNVVALAGDVTPA